MVIERQDERKITRVIAEGVFLDFCKDLLGFVRDEVRNRVANAEKGARITKNNENLQWYFRGYKHDVAVFLEEFWDRIQREDYWKASLVNRFRVTGTLIFLDHL